MFDFDRCPDRTGTYSVKYDSLEENYGRKDLIPLWVADMEFESPSCIREALRRTVDGGVYGYFKEPDSYKDSIVEWLKERQGWDVKREWITYSPAVLRGMSYVLFHFTRPGDTILVMPPVYTPFMELPANNGRRTVFNQLIRHDEVIHNDGGHICYARQAYSFDFEGFARVTAENDVKMMILCNPHNPGGIRWSREDLVRLAEMCWERHILVISDEIHADLHLWGEKHIPFATVCPHAAEISITFGAPSKTFNMPGLSSAFCIIPNPALREDFFRYLTVNEFNWPLITTSVATVAAYREGNPWREECLHYIEGNISLVQDYLSARTPSIKVIRPDASYLIWLDCRQFAREKTGTAAECSDIAGGNDMDGRLFAYFTDELRIALNRGAQFGPGGDGFMRMNAACPRKMLMEALERMG